MAGNVAEWTNTAFDETVYDFSHDMSPEYEYNAKADDPPSLKRKVIARRQLERHRILLPDGHAFL